MGNMTIIKIVPDALKVKKGQIIAELDSGGLPNLLINQRITTMSAEANFLNAKLAREVAEIALKEYVEGDYVAQQAEVEGNIKLAEAELALAEDEKAAKSSSTPTPLQSKRAELAVLRARIALERAQSHKRLLVEYTKGKKIKELASEVKKAHSDELARQATWELEKSKEDGLE